MLTSLIKVTPKKPQAETIQMKTRAYVHHPHQVTPKKAQAETIQMKTRAYAHHPHQS